VNIHIVATRFREAWGGIRRAHYGTPYARGKIPLPLLDERTGVGSAGMPLHESIRASPQSSPDRRAARRPVQLRNTRLDQGLMRHVLVFQLLRPPRTIRGAWTWLPFFSENRTCISGVRSIHFVSVVRWHSRAAAKIRNMCSGAIQGFATEPLFSDSEAGKYWSLLRTAIWRLLVASWNESGNPRRGSERSEGPSSIGFSCEWQTRGTGCDPWASR